MYSKGHSTSINLCQDDGECGFHDHGPFASFICCEVSSLIRNNVVWKTMMVDKGICKTSNFGRSIWTEKENLYPMCLFK